MALLSVIVTGLLAGSLFMGTFGVKRAVRQLDAPELRLRHALIRALRVLMPALMLLTLAATIGEAVISAGAAGHAAGVGAAAALVVLLISLSVHSPLNRVFPRWSPEAIPANASALISRWNRWDAVRVGFALAAFAGYRLRWGDAMKVLVLGAAGALGRAIVVELDRESLPIPRWRRRRSRACRATDCRQLLLPGPIGRRISAVRLRTC